MSKKQQEEWDKEIPQASFLRLLRVNSPEWWLIAMGTVAAMINGSVFPIYAILFGEVLRVFQGSRTDQILEDITVWAGVFLGLACGSAVAIFVKVSSYTGRLSERINSFCRYYCKTPHMQCPHWFSATSRYVCTCIMRTMFSGTQCKGSVCRETTNRLCVVCFHIRCCVSQCRVIN